MQKVMKVSYNIFFIFRILETHRYSQIGYGEKRLFLIWWIYQKFVQFLFHVSYFQRLSFPFLALTKRDGYDSKVFDYREGMLVVFQSLNIVMWLHGVVLSYQLDFSER